jgi:Uma2 family endonuclease
MNWPEVLADPTLRDLPYKIELNEHGSIVMTPASNRHGLLQVRLANRLSQMIPDGEAMVECSIDTPKGVKVADVAWLSAAFLAAHGDETPYPAAPELCVEVVSPSNSAAEINEKKGLYFAKGAKEVWLCDEDGRVQFFTVEGPLGESRLLDAFPSQI